MLAPGQITMVTSEATPIAVTAVQTDSSAPGTATVIAIVQAPNADGDPSQENDKKAIVRHPLFPLLASLFEKCERATQAADVNSSDSFDLDIQDFVQRQEKQQNPFFSDDPDLDSLMVKAIQVLRIHLLELEKVNDLCKDFCSRYISCLKGKMHSENLLRTEGAYDPTTMINPIAGLAGIGSAVSAASIAGSAAGNGVMVQQQNMATQPAVSMSSLGQGQIVSGGTVYQMVQTPQGIVAQPIQFQSQTPVTSSQAIHGSTPLSQIGVSAPTSQPATPTVNTLSNVTAFTTSPDDDDDDAKRKTKRGVLPKLATEVMKSWLFQHIVHPYPTEDEKRQIAGQTNLTLLQVNNWFINARRRILQPMLDASTPDQVKSKKVKPQSKPADRFWPESLANLQPQLPSPVSPPSGEDTSTSHITLSRVEPDQHSATSTDDDEDSQNQAKKMLEIMSSGISGLHPILIPMQPNTILTPDGQIISTASLAAHFAAYQSPLALTTTSSLIPHHTLVIENGAEETIQNTSLSSGLDLSHEEVNSEESDSDSSLVD